LYSPFFQYKIRELRALTILKNNAFIATVSYSSVYHEAAAREIASAIL